MNEKPPINKEENKKKSVEGSIDISSENGKKMLGLINEVDIIPPELIPTISNLESGDFSESDVLRVSKFLENRAGVEEEIEDGRDGSEQMEESELLKEGKDLIDRLGDDEKERFLRDIETIENYNPQLDDLIALKIAIFSIKNSRSTFDLSAFEVDEVKTEIDPEEDLEIKEEKEDEIFKAEEKRDSLKTVMLGSENLYKREETESLKKEYDRENIRGSQFGSRNLEDKDIKEESQKDLNSLNEEIQVLKEAETASKKAESVNGNPENAPSDSKEEILVGDGMESKKSDSEIESEKKGEMSEEPEDAPSSPLIKPGKGRLYEDDPRAKSYLKEGKEKTELPKKKKLKDYKKKEVISKFKDGRYLNMRKDIEGRFYNDEKTKKDELRALDYWVQEQESYINDDKLAAFEDYYKYRSSKNIGGPQISEYRGAASGDERIRQDIANEISEKRKKLAEVHEKMKKAESLGDEENRDAFEKEYKDRKKQLGVFSSYMFKKRQEDKLARRSLSFNKWATRYDESFRPNSWFGFKRQKFNLSVYEGIFNMRHWPGYLGGIALFGVAKGIDWGLNKLRKVSDGLRKNKLLDFSKINLKKIID